MRSALVGLVVAAIGCGSEPESPPPSPASPPNPSSTVQATSTTSATLPTSTMAPAPPPPANAEDAKRLLEERGVDPDDLSREIGEHMRQRLHPQPAR